VRNSDLAQIAAAGVAVVAGLVDRRLWWGAAGVLVIGAVQSVWARRPPTAAKALGLRQMALGLALVAIAAIGKGALS
jgi:hypothetical protein